jgi:hypothetical protein
MVFVDGAAVNKKGRLAEMSRERKISLERNTAETKISLMERENIRSIRAADF